MKYLDEKHLRKREERGGREGYKKIKIKTKTIKKKKIRKQKIKKTNDFFSFFSHTNFVERNNSTQQLANEYLLELLKIISRYFFLEIIYKYKEIYYYIFIKIIIYFNIGIPLFFYHFLFSLSFFILSIFFYILILFFLHSIFFPLFTFLFYCIFFFHFCSFLLFNVCLF